MLSVHSTYLLPVINCLLNAFPSKPLMNCDGQKYKSVEKTGKPDCLDFKVKVYHVSVPLPVKDGNLSNIFSYLLSCILITVVLLMTDGVLFFSLKTSVEYQICEFLSNKI